jgi:hypothetical protein
MKIKRSQVGGIFFLVVLVMGILFLSVPLTVGGTQERPFIIWRKKGTCSTTRNDWMTASQDYPGGTGWMQANGTRPQPTFAAAMAELDRLRTQSCSAEGAACNKFDNDCCLFNVYRNVSTNTFSVAAVEENPGPGFILEKPGLCCEDAAVYAGIAIPCGDLRLASVPGGVVRKTGNGFVSLMGPVTIPTNPPTEFPGLGGSDCFAQDRGAGSVNRDDHYGWAQRQNSSTLLNNLKDKIDLLFNCPGISSDQLSSAFAEFSVLIARHVPNAACFNGDRGVLNTDWSAHEAFARTRSRNQLYNNLQWKVAAAFRCLDRASQASFFADLSVPIARAPIEGRGGTIGDSNGGSGGSTGPGTRTDTRSTGGSRAADPALAARLQQFAGTWYSGNKNQCYQMTVSVSGTSMSGSYQLSTPYVDGGPMQGRWDGDGFTYTYKGTWNNQGCITCNAKQGSRSGTGTMRYNDSEQTLYTVSTEGEDSQIFNKGRQFSSTWTKTPCR